MAGGGWGVEWVGGGRVAVLNAKRRWKLLLFIVKEQHGVTLKGVWQQKAGMWREGGRMSRDGVLERFMSKLRSEL